MSSSRPPPPLKIKLPFTPQSALTVLEWGASPNSSPYCHKDISLWCDGFWCQYIDVDAAPEIESLLPILAEVETQWDLYLANTFALEELRSRSFDDVRLPTEWFSEWLRQARTALHAANS